jgi:hypothetical protein
VGQSWMGRQAGTDWSENVSRNISRTAENSAELRTLPGTE